jgi:diaminohydroxyphosphoribosylaminopyrimidine deaminase / 5-amino-6-(5-phosphoribosylamino)uracil reductase
MLEMSDDSYIKLTLELAKKGIGKVSPNPLVGCVIVKKDKIIGAGYHEKFGEAHAEINAINNSKQSVEGATLYVNLEPCSHTGKTPPCIEAIIENKIKRVVVGTLDMNPLVSGKGIKALKKAGVEVKVGVLEKDCIELNKFFFKYITKKIPFITLKSAQTLDGKIADKKGNSKWITCQQSRKFVHELRTKYDAVLVGANTVNKDDPSLTVRFVEGRNPKKIIIDYELKSKLNKKIFLNNEGNNLILITSEINRAKRKVSMLKKAGVDLIFMPSQLEDDTLNLKKALEEVAKRNISSVLIEGGNKIFTSFIHEKLFDDLYIFISPKILGVGLSFVDYIGVKSISNSLVLKISEAEKSGDDILLHLVK